MWQNYKKMRVKQNLIHFIFAERQQHYKYLLLMLGQAKNHRVRELKIED